jgi:hypothetical protein
MNDSRHDDGFRIELREPAITEVALLQSLQRVLLKHPVAAQAAFTALVREGRQFATTPEGRLWRERLAQSAVLQQVRLVLDLATLGMLEERGDSEVPSSYLDALFMLASGGETDAVLNQLFWGEHDREPAGD